MISSARLKLAKNQANAKQHLQAKLWVFENYSYFSSTLSSKKKIGHILKNKQKDKCVCIYEIIWLIIMKVKMKMKNWSHRYDINRTRSRHGHKYSKYKRMMMLICSKQHLSNIWSWIHAKVKQHWGWIEESVAYK